MAVATPGRVSDRRLTGFRSVVQVAGAAGTEAGDEPAQGGQDGRLARELMDATVLVLELDEDPGELPHVAANLLEVVARDLEVVCRRLGPTR